MEFWLVYTFINKWHNHRQDFFSGKLISSSALHKVSVGPLVMFELPIPFAPCMSCLRAHVDRSLLIMRAATVRCVWRILQLMCVCAEYLQWSLAGRSTRAISCAHQVYAQRSLGAKVAVIKTLGADSPAEGVDVNIANNLTSNHKQKLMNVHLLSMKSIRCRLNLYIK